MKSNKHEGVWLPIYCIRCNTGPRTMRVSRVNGVALKAQGLLALEDYVLTGAKVCVKAYGLIQKSYNPNRIKTPLKRTNPRKVKDLDPGWVEIS